MSRKAALVRLSAKNIRSPKILMLPPKLNRQSLFFAASLQCKTIRTYPASKQKPTSSYLSKTKKSKPNEKLTKTKSLSKN
jgi:hypothetical protein